MKLNHEKPKLKSFFDTGLLIILTLLMITSIIALYSSSPFLDAKFTMPSLLSKQIMWFVLGSVVLAVFIYNGNDYIVPLFKILYFIMLGLLILLALDSLIFQKIWPIRGLSFGGFDPIIYINGATSWYNIPGIGSFQPSEFMKICLVILNADIIAKHNFNRERSTYSEDFSLLLKMAKITLIPVILIFIQPDTGLVLIIFISLFFMAMSAGMNKMWAISILGSISIILIIFFILFFYFPDILDQFISRNRLLRIYAWIYPEQYPASSYQSVHAVQAYGSAGISGYGLSSIPNTIHISEPHTDYIFAMFGTLFGSIGMYWIVFLQFLLTAKLFRIAYKAKTLFEKYIMIGIIGIILYQQIQNMGMVLKILPITGITLPLISYGGSSLLSYFILFGIVMNISTNSNKKANHY